MESKIEYMEVNENATIFTVRYNTGTVKTFTIGKLPNSVYRFLLESKPEKQFIKRLPKFGPGKNNYNIVGELKFYIIVA